MNKSVIIAKREFLEVIRKKSFWLSTIIFPIFLIVVMLISAYSSTQVDEKLNNSQNTTRAIYIEDKLGFFENYDLPENIKFIEDSTTVLDKIKSGETSVLFVFQEDFLETRKVEVFKVNEDPFTNESFNSVITYFVDQKIYSQLNTNEAEILQLGLDFNVTTFEDGEQVNVSLGSFVVPGIAIFLYFMMITVGNSFLLSSVSEEKESRMIEIILSTVKSRELILGKLMGLVSIILLQLLVLIVLSAGVLLIAKDFVSIDIGSIDVDPATAIFSLVVALIGFMIMANAMIGVGGAMPTLKEAQGFSSIFVMLSIFPVYFVSLLIADPNGELARILSYTPISAPIVVLFRNTISPLNAFEMITIFIGLIIQLIISFYLAFKLFEIGSLEYNNKISIRSLFRKSK